MLSPTPKPGKPTMSKLIYRALATHQKQLSDADAERQAYIEGKRAFVLEQTHLYATALFGASIEDEAITLVPCTEREHPNVYSAARFWFEGLYFSFAVWSASWSVMADESADQHAFKDLASLGEALRHPDFAHLTAPCGEEDDYE